MPTTSQSVGLAAGALFFIILMFTPRHAKAADPWTRRDTALQSAFLGLMWIDYRQTLAIRTGKYNVTEANGVLGRHPSRGEVTRYFAGTALAHTLLMTVLPKDWRLALQSGAIGVQLAAVSSNYQVGIAIRF